MDDTLPGGPNIFPPGEEPDWVVGYEITENGWRAMDAAREEERLRESEESIEREGTIPHEEVMAQMRRWREALIAAPAK